MWMPSLFGENLIDDFFDDFFDDLGGRAYITTAKPEGRNQKPAQNVQPEGLMRMEISGDRGSVSSYDRSSGIQKGRHSGNGRR